LVENIAIGIVKYDYSVILAYFEIYLRLYMVFLFSIGNAELLPRYQQAIII